MPETTHPVPEWATTVADQFNALTTPDFAKVRHSASGWLVEIDVTSSICVEVEPNWDDSNQVFIAIRTYAPDHGCSAETELGFYPIDEAAARIIEAICHEI